MTTNINPNRESSESQCAKIKDWLESGNTLTSIEALQMFGCFRLASRICDLKQQGMKITDRWKTTETGKRVKEYLLAV